MDAKQYLRQLNTLQRRVDYDIMQAEHLDSQTRRITQVLSSNRSGGTGSNDKMGDSIAALMDWKAKLEDDAAEMTAMLLEAKELLNKIRKPAYKELLFRRYIVGDTFEDIAESWGQTPRNVYYTHGKALQVFRKLMEENSEKSE